MTPNIKLQQRSFMVLLLVLLCLFFILLKPFLMPILLAVVLVVLFYPLFNFFKKLFRGRVYLASFVSTLLMVLLLLIPGALVSTLVVNQGMNIVGSVVDFLEKNQFAELLRNWNLNIQHLIMEIQQRFKVEINLSGIAANTAKQIAYYAYQYSPAVVSQTLSFITQGFILLIVVFFLFVEAQKLYQEIIFLTPLKDSDEHVLAAEIQKTIYGVVYGTFVTALVQAILAGIGFYFAGIQGFLVWATLTFFFSFVPVVGAAAVWLPASIILCLQGHLKAGLILAAYGVLFISMVDNIVKPILMKTGSNIHPLLLFFSVMGGLSLAGPIGFLIGPIIMAIFMATLKIYKRDYLGAKSEA